MRRGIGWIAAFGILAAAGTGCQERLTGPGECPELCPGGESPVFDLVLNPLANSDTSYTGYVARTSAGALLTSNGLPASEDRAVYRFNARADSIAVRDTLRPYTVDSALLAVNLIARDTLVNGLKLYLYRIDPAVDIDDTFESVDAQLLPAAIIDSIEVPDSVNAGLLQTVIRGADLAKVALPVGTGGVLAIAVGMAADQPSGVRLGASAAGTGPSFISYVTLDVPDTGSVRHQSVTRAPAFNATFTRTPVVPDDAFLTIGGEPSSRALLRFDLPGPIEDSATIVRATLELVPVSPLLGLPTDPPALEARALFADLGAKSPVVTTDTRFIVADTLSIGTADTVRLDVTPIVRLWQSSTERPDAVFLRLLPEAASFTRPVFGSTRSGAVGAPRLRITYLKTFPFENP
ncbi:MAG TPA: hypothetical protein VG500_18000 [Gemmatimonadales bacterium]|nr:hypothetical protein [Gemmatimonadales bacterium]